MFALLEKAKRGDAAAIDALVELASSVAGKAVRKYVRSDSRLELEDLVQDTLLAVARDLHDCRSETRAMFCGWVGSVSFNTVQKARCKLMAQRRGCGLRAESIDESRVPGGSLPTDVAIARETWAAVQDVIDSYEPRCRERIRSVVGMLSQGCSYAEIIESTESTAAATYGVIKRFRQKLDEAGISLA